MNLNNPDRFRATKKPRNLLGIPNGCRESYPLEPIGPNFSQPFKPYGKLDAATISGQFVNLVDHHGLDISKVLSHSPSGKDRLQCFWCGYQEVRGSPSHSPAISSRSVSVSYLDCEA